MSGDVSSVHGIPGHLWNLGLAVQACIDTPDGMVRWRDMVQRWAAEKRVGVPLVPLPHSLTGAEQYAVLAAIHDVCAEVGGGRELIDPWSGDDAESRTKGIPYHVLLARVVPPPHGIGRRSESDEDEQPMGITEGEAERLTALLAGLTAESIGGRKEIDASQEEPPRQPANQGKQPKLPTREAWAAYYLRQCGDGLTQEQIVNRLSQEGIITSQPSVHRMLKACDEFRQAGGLAPTLEELAATSDPRKAVRTDPAILDKGERQDGRTPRQRDKMVDPAEEWD